MTRAGHLVAALAIALLPTAGRAATLSVSVQGVRSGLGHVRIGVCERAEFLHERCVYNAIVSARPGTVVATIPDVRPGVYAVAAYQDETDLGHLRRGLFGIPRGGMGFSRDPKPGFGPPSFGSCALRVGMADAAIAVTLHYY